MIKLVFPGSTLADLAAAMRAESRESFALVLARPARTASGDHRLLVRSVHVAAEGDYEARSEREVRPTVAFRLLLEKRARQKRCSLIYVHSHPDELGQPQFSDRDDHGEQALAAYAAERVPTVPHLALLIGADGYRARELGAGPSVEVWQVGRHALCPDDLSAIADRFDRQVRAFGAEGQRAIQRLRIAIIGLGGTGSLVAQQLAYLGIRRFLLIDPDVLDETSFNRVVGSDPSLLGQPKVHISADMIRGIAGNITVDALQRDVLEPAVGNLLTDVDFIFCCTDSHGSRFFVNQLAYQFFVPCIDMGVVITPQDGKVVHFGGRVQMLAPGLSCLVCRDGVLSPNDVRRDLSNAKQRAADPYFSEAADIKQPAVISLNSQVAGQAVTMFLASVAGIPMNARSQAIRGMKGDVRVLDDTPIAHCLNCSEPGFYGQGDRYDLPSRHMGEAA